MSLPAITRTATTETRYLDRFGQLWRRAGTELDRSIRVLDFVRQFLIWAPQFSGSSVRQYRATIRFGLERLARHNPHLRAEVAEALTLLDGSRQQDPAPAPRGKPKASIPLRTSASKAKVFPTPTSTASSRPRPSTGRSTTKISSASCERPS